MRRCAHGKAPLHVGLGTAVGCHRMAGRPIAGIHTGRAAGRAPRGAARETGHAYLADVPHLIACALTIVLAGLVLAAYEGVRGNARTRVPVWPVALLPPLGFAAQEYLERLIS